MLLGFLVLALLTGGMGLAAAQDDSPVLEGQIVFLSPHLRRRVWLTMIESTVFMTGI